MAQGPGKYDVFATMTRNATSAEGVIVIVLGGSKGSGFSVQASPEVTQRLPEMLRMVADEIERDLGDK
jgi:UDP-N-acetylglucosamine:LPS N-acetylglucosamine transferase